MRRLVIGFLGVLVLAAMSGPAFAQPAAGPVIAVHLTAHPLKGAGCDYALSPMNTSTPCDQYTVSGDLLTSYDIWLAVANQSPTNQGPGTDGISGLSCGIVYEMGNVGDATGVMLDMYGWTLCASGLQFPNDGGGGDWPASGGGNRITWDNTVDCQRTVLGSYKAHAVAGFFYVYAYGQDAFQLTPNNNLVTPETKIIDCSNQEVDVAADRVGYLQFSAGATEQGCSPCANPCQPIPVRPTTWGKIKQQY